MESNTAIAETSPIEESEEYKKLFEFETARHRIDKLISAWNLEKEKTKVRRNMRNIEVDIEDLQLRGRLKPDETFIPARVIDSSIEREKPPYISFLTQSRRLAIFQDLDNPNQNTEQIEEQFSKGMRFPKWEKPFFKCLDGGQLHGWNFVEVEHSESRNLGCNIDYIEHDKLMFPTDSEDIQANDIVIREYNLTVNQLKKFVKKYGFSKEEVDKLIEREIKNDDPKNLVIFKCWWKFEGLVYVAWYAKGECTTWIKAPELLWRGKKKKVRKMVQTTQTVLFWQVPSLEPQDVWENVYEERYPIHAYFYSETEEKQIMRHKGRAFKDGPNQEAQTALISSYVNGSTRASNVYGSPKNRLTDSSGTIKKADINLEHGCFYSEPVEFWGPQFPPLDLLKGVSALETQKQVETGQVAYAVNNRQESRKTAEEVKSAKEENNLLDSVEVTLFSTFVREVLIDCWSITQSLALQGTIRFLPTVVESIGPLGEPKIEVVNDVETIGRNYEIYAAGDVDVIQRAEKRNKRAMLWPIISQTAAAIPFLIDILKEELPEDAEKYSQMLMSDDAKGALLNGIVQVLNSIVADSALKPEFAQYNKMITELAKQAQTLSAQPIAA